MMMRYGHTRTILVLLALLLTFVIAQSRVVRVSVLARHLFLEDSVQVSSTLGLPGLPPVPTATTPLPPGTERIFIENVDVWRFDADINPDAQILTGNVIFRHKDAYMYCDSALLYQATNRFEAYGAVRIDQGDSVHAYSGYLDYDGILMLAQMRDLVRLEQGNNILYTDNLDYNRMNGLAYYFDNGSIVDSLNVLSSTYGEYSTITKQAVFNDNVRLENDNFTMTSDTLHYDTNTKIATILGPTTIVNDSGRIEATRGTYDTGVDRATLLDRAEVFSGTRWMQGDSMFYDRPQHLAEMYGNVILRDTAEKVELRGNYIEYHEDTEYGLAKDSAYVMEGSSKDALYAHAKVMEMMKVDSVNNVIRGVGNVRLYRSDVQATSDSMIYYTKDSLIHCIGSPFIWSGKSQVTGDSITFYIKDGAVQRAHIRENAYLASEVEGKYFDQVRGREVMAYFNDNKMDSVRTSGNAETIYYSLNPDSIALEQVRSQSSAILMQFEEDEIFRIVLFDKTTGSLTPTPLLTSDQYAYPSFVWFPEGRPRSFIDIFRTTPRPGTTTQSIAPAAPTGGLLSDPEENNPQETQTTNQEKEE